MTQTDPEVIRRLTTAEQVMEDLVMPEITVDLISPFLQLPGLRLFVPTSGFDSAGNATDMSGLGHHLTYNGNPTYNDDGLAPYIDLDGTGDYLSHADHADFDILGTETYVAAKFRGLTVGGWFYPTLNTSGLITKGTSAAPNSSYEMFIQAPNTLTWRVSTGAAYITLAHTTLAANTWQFLVGRYTPSLELKSWIDEDTALQLVGVPAALPNVAASFEIGAFSVGALPYTGRASCCFVCAVAVTDLTISALRESTKAAYGVD